MKKSGMLPPKMQAGHRQKRVKQNTRITLTVDYDLLDELDATIDSMDMRISRSFFIVEAIVEKIQKQRVDQQGSLQSFLREGVGQGVRPH